MLLSEKEEREKFKQKKCKTIMKTETFTISSIDVLLQTLDPVRRDPKGYTKIMNALNLEIKEIEKYCHWNTEFYTRNLIHKTNAYEIMVLCWEKGQCSPIHNHQDQDCWMYVAAGNIDEIYFHQSTEKNGKLKLTEGNQFHHKQSEMSYINDNIALHEIRNVGNSRAITIHLYSLPIEMCSIYKPETGEVIQKKLGYYSIGGKLVKE